MEVRDVIPFSFVGREISNSVRIAGVYNIVLSVSFILRMVKVSPGVPIVSCNHPNPVKIDVLGSAFIIQLTRYFSNMVDALRYRMFISCAWAQTILFFIS